MKFVLSFSGGKDSMLALHKMTCDGHEPVALLVMFRDEMDRSWVHGMDSNLLKAVSDALEIPLLCCHAGMDTYNADMERALRQAKDLGAEACAFGDIDIEEHRMWDETRCAAVGLKAVLPLWQRNREENVEEILQLGYQCVVKCIRNDLLPEAWLGLPLSASMLDEMRRLHVDLCGENGEYHTVVVGGPLFRHPVSIESRGIVRMEQITAVDLAVCVL